MPTTASPPRSPAGYASDHTGWSTAFADMLETVPALVWPDSVRTFGQMRHDPQLAAVLNAYTLPLRSAPWSVDPAGVRDEVAQLVADDLGLPILGTEPEPSAARRRGVRWEEHMRLALLHLVFGHMPFAQAYDIIDGRARLSTLSERMPSTITAIETNDDGTLRDILQFGEKATIPARNLTWYVHEREGAAWQGRSMLRPAYGAWLIKHEMWRVLATSSRRFGMGVPNYQPEAGTNPTPQQIAEAQRMASAARVGDQSGVGGIPGFRFELTGLTGSTPDTLGFIRYLDQQMAQMALASVLNLDASPNGSRALGETMVDLLLLSLNSIAGNMADTTTGLSVQMVDYNWGEDEPAPRIVCGDVGSRPEVTAEAIGALMGVGAIVADPALEQWVRERYRLPQRDPDAPPTPAPPVMPAAGSRRNRGVAAAAAGSGLRREPTVFESAAKTDFAVVQATWQSALNKLVADWAAITVAQRAALVSQVSAAVDDDDAAALGALAVDSQAAADLLAEYLHDSADDAATEMLAEAERQGVMVKPAKVKPDRARLDQVATALSALVAGGLAASAARRALQVWQPGATGVQVAGEVTTWLAGLGDATLRDSLGAGLSIAQNIGRMAVLSAGPIATYAASEILDANTCDPCAEVDGQEFADLADADEAYASGGYRDCEGGLRCRGIVVAVWDTSTVEQQAA